MRFEWDEVKRRNNIQKHGIDFVDAVQVFYGDPSIIEDTRSEYGESRFWAIGLAKGIPLLVVHTYPNEHTIRIISARRATKQEQQYLFT